MVKTLIGTPDYPRRPMAYAGANTTSSAVGSNVIFGVTVTASCPPPRANPFDNGMVIEGEVVPERPELEGPPT